MTATASRTATGSRRRRRAAGFTYVSLVILVAIIGLVTAATLKMGAVLQRARAERELLRIGAEFSDALQSYADATPIGKPSQPASLKDLLKDPRFPSTRRHLRKIYADPMTGKAQWGIVYLGDKVGVIGVYSLSDAKPVKIGNFPARFQGFESKQHLSEWKFTTTGKPASAGVTPAPTNNSQMTPVVAPAPQIAPSAAATPPKPPDEPPKEAPKEAPAEPVPPAPPSGEAPPAPPPEAPPPPPPSEDKPADNRNN